MQRDFDPKNFAQWTSINLGHCIDFLDDIISKHGNLTGEYDSLEGIKEALETNRDYAIPFQKYWENDNEDSIR